MNKYILLMCEVDSLNSQTICYLLTGPKLTGPTATAWLVQLLQVDWSNCYKFTGPTVTSWLAQLLQPDWTICYNLTGSVATRWLDYLLQVDWPNCNMVTHQPAVADVYHRWIRCIHIQCPLWTISIVYSNICWLNTYWRVPGALTMILLMKDGRIVRWLEYTSAGSVVICLYA